MHLIPSLVLFFSLFESSRSLLLPRRPTPLRLRRCAVEEDLDMVAADTDFMAAILAEAKAKGPKPVLKDMTIRPVSLLDVELRFSRSGGAGGQNVNKVNTKAELRLNLVKAESWIIPEVMERLKGTEATRINKDGVLVVSSTRHRSQKENMQDALDKIQEMLDQAVTAAAPKKGPSEDKVKRMKSLAAAEDRKKSDLKKKNGAKKEGRRRVSYDD